MSLFRRLSRLLLISVVAAACGPAHMELVGPVTFQGKYTGTIAVQEGGRVVLDFQGRSAADATPSPNETQDQEPPQLQPEAPARLEGPLQVQGPEEDAPPEAPAVADVPR